MDFTKLEYFRCVAKHENMTKAAKELFISQPAVSKSIKELEKELESDLFIRQNGGIVLSNQGKVFLKYVNRILSNLNDAKIEITDSLEDITTIISIELIVGSDLFADIFIEHLRKFPNVQFSINQTKDPVGMYDLSINSSFNKTTFKNSEILLEEDIKVGVPKSHVLAKHDSITLQSLNNEGFIMLNKGKSLRKMVDYYCNYFGFTPKILWETDNSAMCREMVREGFALTFIPEKSWGKFNSDIKLLEIDGFEFKRYISISWQSDRSISKATLNFKNYIVDYFKNNKYIY